MPTEACDLHPGGWANACAGCAADRLAGDPTPRATTGAPPNQDYLAAKAGLNRGKP